MKRILTILMMLMLTFAALNFTACGDDEEAWGGNIVGTWKTDIWGDGSEYDYIQFREDGTYIEVDVEMWDWDGKEHTEIDYGTWRTADGNLYVEESGNDPVVCKYRVSGNKLTIQYPENLGLFIDIKLVYVRVSSSVIEKYLTE